MGKGGGGSGGGGGASSGTQETIQREAPGVESRKLALYDEAVKLAQQPVSIPAYQVAGPTGLEQTGFQQAATTGVGQQAVGQGITSLQAGLGSAFGAPNVSQFFNPYQSYVTDEINRQAQIGQNQLAAQAVQAGAFGGGREGVQRAELDRARLETIGQSQAQGFQTALGAAQQQQGLQAQAGLQTGQALGQFGAQQQAMQQGDIQSLLQAGGVQRALGQQALEAQRATSLAQQYEPYQRVEFLKNVMTNLPTGQSSITATTAPGSNPLAQAAGAGLGAYTAYSLLKKKEGGLVSIKKFQSGGAVVGEEVPVPVKKKQEGFFSEEEKFAYLAAPVIGSLLQARTAPGQSNLQSLFGAVGQGVSQIPEIGLTMKKIEASVDKKKSVGEIKPLTQQQKIDFKLNPEDEYLGTFTDGVLTAQPTATYKSAEAKTAILKDFEKTAQADGSLKNIIADLNKFGGGDLPGVGPIAGRLPKSLVSEEGVKFRGRILDFVTKDLKEISGGTVTTDEYERYAGKYGGLDTANETVLRSAMIDAQELLEKAKIRALEKTDSKTAKSLIDSGAITLYEAPIAVRAAAGRIQSPKDNDANTFTVVDKDSGLPIKYKKVNNNILVLDPRNNVYVSLDKFAKTQKVQEAIK